MPKSTRAAVPLPLVFLGVLVIGLGQNFLWPNPIFTEALNNLWVAIAVLKVYVDGRIIRSEERHLEQQFGDEYLDYKRSVRRWL